MTKEAQGGKLYRGLANAFGPFLGTRGFECISYKFDEAVFGNELIEFTAGDVHLRLINDREQFFADIGKEDSATWVACNDLLEILGVPQKEISAGITEMPVLGKLLTKHYAAMLDLLSPAKIAGTRETILALQQARAKEMTARHSGQTIH